MFSQKLTIVGNQKDPKIQLHNLFTSIPLIEDYLNLRRPMILILKWEIVSGAHLGLRIDDNLFLITYIILFSLINNEEFDWIDSMLDDIDNIKQKPTLIYLIFICKVMSKNNIYLDDTV